MALSDRLFATFDVVRRVLVITLGSAVSEKRTYHNIRKRALILTLN